MTHPVAGFDWDAANRDKCQKHGVSLATIEALFERPLAVSPDPAHAAAEERVKTSASSARSWRKPSGPPTAKYNPHPKQNPCPPSSTYVLVSFVNANTPLAELDDAARRADITAHGLDALRAFIDLSQHLATLIVEDAKATLNGAGDPTGKPSRKIDHAHDFNLIFRAARRGILLREKLLALPRPAQAGAAPRPTPPGTPQDTGRPGRERPDRERIDRIDTLDRIDPLDRIDDDDDLDEALAGFATDAASILTISRKYLPPTGHGETTILPPPLPEPITEAQTLDAQIAEVLQRTRDAVNAYVLATKSPPTKPPPANATAPPNTS
jgi:hypothetical protein